MSRAALLVSVVLFGCSGSKNSGFGGEPPPSDSGTDSGTDPGDAGVVDDDASFGTGDSGVPTRGCSPDLRHVIDETGKAVETCSPDHGCAAGACVPACDAASASKGNIGCDFVVATPSFYPGIAPPCFTVFMANGWARPVKINVSRGGTSYDVTTFGRIASTGHESTWPAVPSTGLPEGKVAVLFLSSDPNSVNGGTSLACPVTPAINSGTAVAATPSPAATGRGQAWHITTDAPLSAYDIIPYGGAKSFLPSAELIFPTSAWGKNFVGVVPPRGRNPSDQNAAQWAQIVATQDATNVKVVPTQALPAGTNVVAAPANAVTTYTLNAGEFIQWQPTLEITGSVLESDKPIAFVGGQAYLCLASQSSTGGGCDSGHQMIPPVAALGSEYLVAAYATRRNDTQDESIPYRIVGAVDGTTLTYDPAVAGAPTAIKSGQVIDFEARGSFVMKSQDNAHPFYVSQMMPGCFVTSGTRGGSCEGDEEFINVLPPAQYLARYVFFTDPSYPTTNLVMVRSKTAAGFKDVDLDCLGTVTGWRAVGTGGKYEVTNVDLIRARVKNGTCDNGPHAAKSDGPFGVIVWGLDSASSYGYPAGGNSSPINTVVVPPTPR